MPFVRHAVKLYLKSGRGEEFEILLGEEEIGADFERQNKK